MEAKAPGPGFAVPNLIHWVLFGIAVVLTFAVPIRLLPKGAIRPLVGLSLVATGVLLWLWGQATMRRHGTSPDPGRAPSALVDDGPYRFSRNPTYLGLVVVFVGVAVAVNSIWLLAFTVAELFLADRQARREESFLEAVFGEPYVDYRSRVRRWL
jgi:protein-S-isoprenylcysteine O-methyltransferase Ste14